MDVATWLLSQDAKSKFLLDVPMEVLRDATWGGIKLSRATEQIATQARPWTLDNALRNSGHERHPISGRNTCPGRQALTRGSGMGVSNQKGMRK